MSRVSAKHAKPEGKTTQRPNKKHEEILGGEYSSLDARKSLEGKSTYSKDYMYLTLMPNI